MTEGQNKNKNRRRFTQIKKGNISSTSKNTSNGTNNKSNNLAKNRELKFHLHDSAQRKTSESFNKIVEAIVTKIQKTFDDSVDLVTSIEQKTKKVYAEPEPE